jgi:hypothetical protein
MDSSAFNHDCASWQKQTGNGNKVNSTERLEEDDAGSSSPRHCSATPGQTYLATGATSISRTPLLAYKPLGRPLAFPFKLHSMLDDVEERGIQHIVSWMPSGIAFRVHKTTEFIADVVPRYFNLTKYKSFKRQLVNYGFKRIEGEGGIRDVLGKLLCY